MKSRRGSLIQLNIAVLLWGGTSMFAKGVSLPIAHIICLRSLVAAAALFLFLVAIKASMRVKPKHLWVMILLGAILCLHWLTLFFSLRISSGAVALLAFYTYPVATVLVEPILFREKLQKADIALAVGVFAGVLIMVPEVSLGNSTTAGIVVGIISGLFFMARNLITRGLVHEYAGSVLMFWQVIITGLLLLPVLFLRVPFVPSLFLSGDCDYATETIWLLLLLGVIFTAIPQTLFSASLKNLSAKTVGILAALQVFYVAVLGYFIHDEHVTLRTVVGGLIILACIVIETVKHVSKA